MAPCNKTTCEDRAKSGGAPLKGPSRGAPLEGPLNGPPLEPNLFTVLCLPQSQGVGVQDSSTLRTL